MAEKMDSKVPEDLLDFEYEAQLYGFSILSMKNTILETMDDVIKETVSGVKPLLMKRYQNEKEVDTVVDRLTNAYLETRLGVDGKLEEAIKEFYVIDKNSLLASDAQFQEKQYTQEEEEELDRKLEVVKRNRTSKLILANELKRICDLLEPYDELEEGLKNVHEILNGIDAISSDTLSSLQEAQEIEDIIEKSFPELSLEDSKEK